MLNLLKAIRVKSSMKSKLLTGMGVKKENVGIKEEDIERNSNIYIRTL